VSPFQWCSLESIWVRENASADALSKCPQSGSEVSPARVLVIASRGMVSPVPSTKHSTVRQDAACEEFVLRLHEQDKLTYRQIGA